MTDYLADTSVFIAAEQGRALSAPPSGAARVSVATLVHDLVVRTQDAGFDVLAGVAPALRVHRG